MVNYLVNSYWQHPVAYAAAAVAAVLIIIWMTGSGSRQRFITLRRTKESEQLARDLSRIAASLERTAASLERIARSHESPADFVGRPIPTGFENTIVRNHSHAEDEMPLPAAGGNGEGNSGLGDSEPAPATRSAAAGAASPMRDAANPFSDRNKLDLPNPLYRPK